MRGITRVTFVNAAETVRRQCLVRTLLADFFRSLLVFSSAFQIPQSNLQRPASDFRPADLGVFRQHGCGFGILDIELNHFNDAVFNLHVSHVSVSSV